MADWRWAPACDKIPQLGSECLWHWTVLNDCYLETSGDGTIAGDSANVASLTNCGDDVDEDREDESLMKKLPLKNVQF